MSWGSDFENLATVAKDRHAEMLAYAMRQQQLKAILPGREHKGNVWQWLRQTLLGELPKESSLEPSSTHRTVLQS